MKRRPATMAILLALAASAVAAENRGDSVVLNSGRGADKAVDPAKLEAAILKADRMIETDPRASFKNVDSLIVCSQGEIFFEKYYNGFQKGSRHVIQSQTKSIVALLMGMAIDRGFVKSENEPATLFFPGHFDAGDKLKSTVTIKHLLTMTAGFDWEEMLPLDDPKNDNMNMFNSGDWLRYAISRPMSKKPFTEFGYNSGCPMIVAGIIEKASKMKLDEFAGKYLFEPLEITEYLWLKDKTGFCHAGGGLSLKPMDMMKIGMLVMNNGRWKDRRLVSEDWVRKATSSYFPTSFDDSAYGYYWWIRERRTGGGTTAKMISAEGAGGQKLYLFPEYRLIIAFTERNDRTPQVSPLFIAESILPILE